MQFVARRNFAGDGTGRNVSAGKEISRRKRGKGGEF